MNCEVPLPSSKSPQCIPSQISLSKGAASRGVNRRRTERPYALGTIRATSGHCSKSVVDGLPSWILRSIQIERNSGNDVWPSWRERSQHYNRKHVHWGLGPSLKHILQRPTSKDCICKCIDRGCRNVISDSAGNYVTDLEIRRPTF